MEWMDRYPSGLDPRIVKLREENRDRIIGILIEKLDQGLIKSERYRFSSGMSQEQKFLQMLEWWEDHRFHLTFAVRSPALLNELLGNSLDPQGAHGQTEAGAEPGGRASLLHFFGKGIYGKQL